MACPYFYPTAKFDAHTWVISPRLPLGDPHTGECRAGSLPFQPDDDRMRHTCNVGYARGQCDRFPAGSDADAIRFHVAADSEKLIRIQYVFEKNCWPLRHGAFEYSTASDSVSGNLESEVLQQQAAVFIASYLRRRGSA